MLATKSTLFKSNSVSTIAGSAPRRRCGAYRNRFGISFFRRRAASSQPLQRARLRNAGLCDHATVFDEATWLPVREGRERRELRTFELVLTARGIDSRIDWRAGVWLLLVAEDDLTASEREIASYESENVAAPTMPLPTKIDSGKWGVGGYLAIIWTIMALDALSTFGRDWRGSGRLHVAAAMDGELWRLVTALTLHSDLGHIVANSVFGGLFGWLAGRYLGSGLAWLCIVAGGALGNALNVLVRPDYFASIGASTATFAAVGLCGAFMWRSGYFRRLPWRRGFAPVFAAIAFFAYTGIGDENTDVVAHLTGLGCGFLLGLWVAHTRLQLVGIAAQRFFGLVAFASVALAWMVAA